MCISIVEIGQKFDLGKILKVMKITRKENVVFFKLKKRYPYDLSLTASVQKAFDSP